HVHLRAPEVVEGCREGHIPEVQSSTGPVRLLHGAHSCAARALSRFSEESLPRISIDSNSGGGILRPGTATRSGPWARRGLVSISGTSVADSPPSRLASLPAPRPWRHP